MPNLFVTWLPLLKHGSNMALFLPLNEDVSAIIYSHDGTNRWDLSVFLSLVCPGKNNDSWLVNKYEHKWQKLHAQFFPDLPVGSVSVAAGRAHGSLIRKGRGLKDTETHSLPVSLLLCVLIWGLTNPYRAAAGKLVAANTLGWLCAVADAAARQASRPLFVSLVAGGGQLPIEHGRVPNTLFLAPVLDKLRLNPAVLKLQTIWAQMRLPGNELRWSPATDVAHPSLGDLLCCLLLSLPNAELECVTRCVLVYIVAALQNDAGDMMSEVPQKRGRATPLERHKLLQDHAAAERRSEIALDTATLQDQTL